MEGLPVSEKTGLAIYGEKLNPEAAIFVSNLKSLFWREKPETRIELGWNEKTEARYKADLKEGIDAVFGKLRTATETRDGSFFRALADAIELSEKPIDPVRTWLGKYMGARELCKNATGHYPATVTLFELHKVFQEYVQKIDLDQFRRICKEMQIPLRRGAVGRPPKIFR